MTTEDDPITIEELNVVRAPGFETNGFAIEDLSPGINLIHGPNGAGKTTTAESISTILWPGVSENGAQLVGQMSLNGNQWRVDVTNGHAKYQRDGTEASPPNLPSMDHQDRYRLSLHDLLQQETRNENFAETIARESAGGYDPSAARSELGYSDSPSTRRIGVFQDAKSAVETWREKRSKAQGLEEERSRLTKLERELQDAKQARNDVEIFEQAITYCKAKSELEATEASLCEFPDVLEQVNGNEFQQVVDCDGDIEEWNQEKTQAEQKLQDAKNTLNEVSLLDDGVSSGTITRLKERRESLKDFESRKNTLEDELRAKKKKRETARGDIPLDVDHDDLVNLDPGKWADVSEFARRAQQVKAEQKFQRSVKRWTEIGDIPESKQNTLERGSKALEEWLITVPDSEAVNNDEAAFRIGAVSGLVVSLAGAALGALVNPLLYSVIIVGVGLFGYGYLQQRDSEDNGKSRKPHRESFEQTGLTSPMEWTEEAVQERLIEIYDEIALHEVTEERHQQQNTLLSGSALDDDVQALDEKREEIQNNLGAAPDTTDLELVVVVRRILDWQAAHDEVISLKEELDGTKESLEQALDTLQTELGEFEYNDVEDAASASEAIRDLEQRKTEYESTTRDLEDARDTIEKASKKISDLEEDQEKIYTALNMDHGDRDELESLCEQVEQYQEIKSEVERAEAVVEQEDSKLSSLPGFDPELKEREITDLKQDLRDAKETAEPHDEIQERITEINTKINEAKTDNAVEEAIAEKDRALDALEGQLDDDYSAMVGDLLVDHVQDVTINANRPAVFQRANELLTTITHGRYELILDEADQSFRAYDASRQKGLSLDELSSGTRVQMLLAVRLAFVEQQEQGMKLPIVLDETLANTDDLRAEVIIESLIELAKEGRQIFYFTAQGVEVAKWRKALSKEPEVKSETIDLAEVRNLNKAVQVPEFDHIETLTPEPPEPTSHDHQSYGEALDVGLFNQYEGAGTAHLWYVVDDIDVLYDLLVLGINRWGQLQNLLERGRQDFVPADTETIEAIQQNAEALEEFAQSWCIGRGKPVDRAALEDSGAISGTFIDRVSELAEDLCGDAEQLVDVLFNGGVDRFRSSKTNELEEYLRENGYIVSTDPLGDDDIKIRMTDRLVTAGVSRNKAAEKASTLLARIARRGVEA